MLGMTSMTPNIPMTPFSGRLAQAFRQDLVTTFVSFWKLAASKFPCQRGKAALNSPQIYHWALYEAFRLRRLFPAAAPR